MVLAEVLCTVELFTWLLVHPGKVCLPSGCTGMRFQLQCAVLLQKALCVMDGERAGGAGRLPSASLPFCWLQTGGCSFPALLETRGVCRGGICSTGKRGAGAAILLCWSPGVKAQLLTVGQGGAAVTQMWISLRPSCQGCHFLPDASVLTAAVADGRS